ncbi:hypothetical protein F8388_005500 [Cannabis sativa]|uniref:Uncharacterized protein n=1 Tax=Cannabis sativa TaxID=3483 RepID=A0A7J6GY81_CANSA|nr:hypothetical protein F8388_005500 [Cannabis sativa]
MRLSSSEPCLIVIAIPELLLELVNDILVNLKSLSKDMRSHEDVCEVDFGRMVHNQYEPMIFRVNERNVYIQALWGSSTATQKSWRGLGSEAEAMKAAKANTGAYHSYLDLLVFSIKDLKSMSPSFPYFVEHLESTLGKGIVLEVFGSLLLFELIEIDFENGNLELYSLKLELSTIPGHCSHTILATQTQKKIVPATGDTLQDQRLSSKGQRRPAQSSSLSARDRCSSILGAVCSSISDYVKIMWVIIYIIYIILK